MRPLFGVPTRVHRLRNPAKIEFDLTIVEAGARAPYSCPLQQDTTPLYIWEFGGRHTLSVVCLVLRTLVCGRDSRAGLLANYSTRGDRVEEYSWFEGYTWQVRTRGRSFAR